MLRRSLNLARRRRALALTALALTAALVGGCKPSAGQRAVANTVVGVGATFPAPLYTRWAADWRPVSGVSVNYQGTGSGGGIEQILAKTVDFGASDEPLTPARLDQAGLYQFPTVIGGVTPVVNIPGVGPGQLKLDGGLLSDIYLGRVTRWNDPRIVALNPGLNLPASAIVVVHRAIASGTTYLFTAYLSAVSATWKAKVGAGDVVAWPTGVADRGNGGVTASVQQTGGAIGYVAYAYVRPGNLAYVQLQDHDGAFVAPRADAFAAAAKDVDWGKAAGNAVLLVDQPGTGAWPITGATFILIHRQPPNPKKMRQVLAFFDWAYRNGDASAASLGYAPLPQAVKDLMRRQWAASIRGADGQPLFKPAS